MPQAVGRDGIVAKIDGVVTPQLLLGVVVTEIGLKRQAVGGAGDAPCEIGAYTQVNLAARPVVARDGAVDYRVELLRGAGVVYRLKRGGGQFLLLAVEWSPLQRRRVVNLAVFSRNIPVKLIRSL